MILSFTGTGNNLATAGRFLRNHLPALLAPHLEQTTNTTE